MQLQMFSEWSLDVAIANTYDLANSLCVFARNVLTGLQRCSVGLVECFGQ